MIKKKYVKPIDDYDINYTLKAVLQKNKEIKK
jgi:hypothetical protein